MVNDGKSMYLCTKNNLVMTNDGKSMYLYINVLRTILLWQMMVKQCIYTCTKNNLVMTNDGKAMYLYLY